MSQNQFDDLAVLMAKISHNYAILAQANKLTLNELHVLYHIATLGPCSPSIIGNKWSLPKQTLNSTNNKLVKKGLISFASSTTDRRKKIISLTPAGKEFVKPIIDQINLAEKNASQQLGKSKFNKLIQIMSELQQLLAKNLD
ncbi:MULTISPECIES: MarR family winged helix-turn-helix transcriptional regulator [Lactobacillus]|uniref:MarR family transcriptional regulator n=1 Tax=Lactobacillus xujianguonis TaxID=2495899 RepID=A0A437SUR6_9LACO|nr:MULTISPECIES: MarR family transcriptional regulator [Lactobacillus]RVU70622.1 MarR family transcriptional regulator [Lactobacillus xujianguonis]RVU73842.1 MarR family transcriptional regulator [Lactobacillus xujianguonis]